MGAPHERTSDTGSRHRFRTRISRTATRAWSVALGRDEQRRQPSDGRVYRSDGRHGSQNMYVVFLSVVRLPPFEVSTFVVSCSTPCSSPLGSRICYEVQEYTYLPLESAELLYVTVDCSSLEVSAIQKVCSLEIIFAAWGHNLIQQ